MAISKVSSSFGLSKALKILLKQCELIREGLTPLNSASNAFSLPQSKPIGAKCFQHLLLKRKTILFDSWVKCKKNLKLASVLYLFLALKGCSPKFLHLVVNRWQVDSIKNSLLFPCQGNSVKKYNIHKNVITIANTFYKETFADF